MQLLQTKSGSPNKTQLGRRRRLAATFVAGIGLSGVMALATPSVSWAVSPSDIANPREVDGTWVADTADLLSPESEVQLNQMISGLEAENGTEIAVVTVTSTAPSFSPKSFATALFNRWGIGKAEADNGILFLVSEGDRRTEIEVGYGLEGILTDAQAGQILRNDVTPKFKAGNFDAGILQGTETLVGVLSGDEAPPTVTASQPKRDYGWVKPVLMLLGLYGFGYLCSRGNSSSNRNDSYYHNDYRYSSHNSYGSSHSSYGGGSDFGGGSSGGGGAGSSW